MFIPDVSNNEVKIPRKTWDETSEDMRANILVNHIFGGGVFVIEKENEVVILPLLRF